MLHFGLSLAPRIFTKLLKGVVTLLVEKGISSLMYLDDCLLLFPHREDAADNVEKTVRIVEGMGFGVNFEKFNMIPSQMCEVLSFLQPSPTSNRNG